MSQMISEPKLKVRKKIRKEFFKVFERLFSVSSASPKGLCASPHSFEAQGLKGDVELDRDRPEPHRLPRRVGHVEELPPKHRRLPKRELGSERMSQMEDRFTSAVKRSLCGMEGVAGLAWQ